MYEKKNPTPPVQRTFLGLAFFFLRLQNPTTLVLASYHQHPFLESLCNTEAISHGVDRYI